MKILLALIFLPTTPILFGVDSPPAEANAVVEKALPFRLPVSELTSSGFVYTAPDGKKQKLVVTAKTAVRKGDRSAVFGDIKLGDVVTGTRVAKTDGDWEILQITNFEPATVKK